MFIGHPGPVPPADSNPRHQRSLLYQVTNNNKKRNEQRATTTITRATVTLMAPVIRAILCKKEREEKGLDRLMDYIAFDFFA